LNPGIYDSHIGKLLNDKGVVAIPTYAFDIYPDRQFDYIYWKNPHDLMTKAYTIAHRRFHQIIKHPRSLGFYAPLCMVCMVSVTSGTCACRRPERGDKGKTN